MRLLIALVIFLRQGRSVLGRCLGTPPQCDSVLGSASCNAVLGCDWDPWANPRGRCEGPYGYDANCAIHGTSQLCANAGCWWDPNENPSGACTGPATPCGDLTDGLCDSQPGCYVQCSATRCTGTPDDCDGGYSTCEDVVGCTYDWGCMGSPVKCSCFDKKAECQAQGCDWQDGQPVGGQDDAVCFPSDATVDIKLHDSGVVATTAIKDLKPGDQVQVHPGVFEPVLFFSHEQLNGQYSFISIVTDEGSILRTSSSHYVLVSQELVAARHLKVGDMLNCRGTPCMISDISSTTGEGLFAPHTPSGVLLVDGVAVSCYTEAFPPTLAKVLVQVYIAAGFILPSTLSVPLFDLLIHQKSSESGHGLLIATYLVASRKLSEAYQAAKSYKTMLLSAFRYS